MQTLLGGMRKATLSFELQDGVKYEANISPVVQVEVQNGYDGGSGFGRYDGLSTLTIRGAINVCGVASAAKCSAKPAPKPKKPSVKASAARVRKATVKHAQLTKKIHDTEQALVVAKRAEEQLAVELKTAREQLVAAAA